MKLAIVLITALGLGLAVALSAVGQSGQITLTTTGNVVLGSTTIPLVTTTNVVPQYMSRAEFRTKRNTYHRLVEQRKYWKCVRHAFPYRLTIYQVPPYRRQPIVTYWKNKAQFWKEHPVCWERLGNGNFDWSLARAAKVFRISYGWIHACSHTEGNTHFGGPIYNRSGSGAYGWMQFMPSTFYSHVGAAFYVARNRGFKVPNTYKYLGSKVGQAITASYMFYRGWSNQWTGYSC